MTEDEMVKWHHRRNGHESEQTLRDSEEQENLTCCGPWGRRVRHNGSTEQQYTENSFPVSMNHLFKTNQKNLKLHKM